MAGSNDAASSTNKTAGKKSPSAKKGGASTKKSMMAVNNKPSIRERDIIDRLERYFGRDITTHNAPIENYHKGDLGSLRALARALNRYDGFHDDRLGLVPADLQGVETIGEVVIAIVVWYRRHGWNVVFR